MKGGHNMGLDMYLLAKTKQEKQQQKLGACGGMFPLAPSNPNNLEQIGYWRKAYSVCDYILDRLGRNYDEVNLVELPMIKDDIVSILDECEFRKEEDYYENDWDKDDWTQTEKFMKKALNLINDGVDIYFQIWY